jgi:hypothetical protein
VSERDQQELDELRRQLDTTFASARPERGFEDELWRRLQARRPWWRRLRLPRPAVAPLAAGLVAVVAVALVTTVVLRGGIPVHTSGGASRSSTTAAAPGARSDQAARCQFGQLPALPGTAASKPSKATEIAPVAPSQGIGGSVLPVYRYDKASGPAAGAVFDPSTLPKGLAAADYPAEAAPTPAPAGAAGQPHLVYVAVPDPTGPYGYLEPAYAVGGDTSGLVPALAPSSYRA